MANDPSSAEPTAVNYSKPVTQASVNVPFAPPNPKAMIDMNAGKRQARLQALMKEVGEAEETRANARIRGEKVDEATHAEGEHEDESEAGAVSAENAAKDRAAGADDAAEAEAEAEETAAKAPEQTPEERKEARRKQVETEERAKLGLEPLEAAAEPDEAAPEAKAKAEADKTEKERKEKFQKVLAMEAKAQKERDRLRSIEGRLVQREKELEQNVARARAEYNRAIQQHNEEIGMARQVLKLAQDNPLELLERAGATPEDVAKWVAQASDPHTVELKRIRAEMAEEKRQAAEYQRQLQRQREENQVRQQRDSVEREYLSSFDEKDDSGEFVFDAALTVYSDRERVRIGEELANEALARKYSFTHRDIAEAVNALAMEDSRYKKIQERLSKVAKPAEAAKVVERPAAQVVKPAPAKPTTVLANSVTQEVTAKPATGVKPDYKQARAQRNRRLIAELDK